MALYECLRPVTRLWYARVLGAGPLVPKPQDAPYIRSGHPRADRILLIGNGPASGWGTLTYQLALVGHLARAMTVRTATPWDADYVGDEPMGIASAREWLGDSPRTGYRVVAVVLGTNDAVRLTPLADWERHLVALLDDLVSAVGDVASITVAGIVPPSRSSRFAGPFGRFADRHAERLNAITERIVFDYDSVSYFPLSGNETAEPESTRAYAALAEELSGELVRTLPAERSVSAAGGDDDRHWEWDVAPHIVDLVRKGGSLELQRIADEAQARFGVAMATVSILDGDRLYYTVNTDRLPNSVPRNLSHCRVVVDADAPLVVPNGKRDDRFRDNPLIDVTHALFYAGFPLHATGGQVVGALCLLNGRPKDAGSVPIPELERFALQAQAELQRLEAEARPRVGSGMPLRTGSI
ncbi:MAG: hypothetical protein QOC55_2447 [Thermoleophilaceae bacterium]|nr:hypothetical protein [Thermoleophilaceae bacterium]